MCGITGCLNLQGIYNTHDLQVIVRKMADTMLHRGPDDGGSWIDDSAKVALGQRRLSIVDLSPEGHQPMASACGRYVLVFNGEIYNFQALRIELEGAGAVFRGHSDTEVMLAAFTRWGIEKSLKRFNGMFAFAVWDFRERKLTLARDRLGEKPLYYAWMNGCFLFGSELKALRAHPAFEAEIDRGATALYLRHNYIPAPYTIYRNVFKLIPASSLTVDLSGQRRLPVEYWSLSDAAVNGAAKPFAGSLSEAAEELDRMLRKSVQLRMIADVPLGAFLSGGVDSSTVVAIMQQISSQPVKTFTIGFHEGIYNEAEFAKAVAFHLKTDHTELYVTPEEAREVIPRLPTLYDEPFADSSQIPTYLVSELARRHVTVSLSGDAGDELFGGYNRYFLGRSLWNKISRIPAPIRKTAAKSLLAMPTSILDGCTGWLKKYSDSYGKPGSTGDKLQKVAEILGSGSPEEMYKNLVSLFKNPEKLVIDGQEHPTMLNRDWAEDVSDFTHRMMFMDALTYLPDDILVKLDRASMGVSLEGRIPFLDHEIVEFAWSLPREFKASSEQGKIVLREVLYRYVPKELIERPKMGFGIPVGDWIKGPLRDWAENLLDEKRLRDEGLLDASIVRRYWKQHLDGARNWQYHLWTVLMLQAWQQQWMSL